MFIQNADVFLNVVEWGDPAKPAFVAHGGWVGNWELWQEPFQLMQHRWRCVGYDHRGAGATTAAADQIQPQLLVDDLIRVLDALQIQECVLAGESLGALTCMAAALQHPDRFAGLVLVDGVPQGGESQGLIDATRSDFPVTVERFVDACIPEPDSDHIRRWGRQILLRADAEAAARILEVHLQTAPDAAQLAVPTLLIHGEQDVIVPVQLAEALASAIPDAKMVTLPGAGHVPTLTRPAVVVDAIEAWWSNLGQSVR